MGRAARAIGSDIDARHLRIVDETGPALLRRADHGDGIQQALDLIGGENGVGSVEVEIVESGLIDLFEIPLPPGADHREIMAGAVAGRLVERHIGACGGEELRLTSAVDSEEGRAGGPFIAFGDDRDMEAVVEGRIAALVDARLDIAPLRDDEGIGGLGVGKLLSNELVHGLGAPVLERDLDDVAVAAARIEETIGNGADDAGAGRVDVSVGRRVVVDRITVRDGAARPHIHLTGSQECTRDELGIAAGWRHIGQHVRCQHGNADELAACGKRRDTMIGKAALDRLPELDAGAIFDRAADLVGLFLRSDLPVQALPRSVSIGSLISRH
ncbi:hypothetical protein RHSP_47818 [Rhizobium freirei PRF 81]|uniref:Uncharacterized protein n=1 Tax=Rhizobium freirei PRF 81 TaxID=363754 RepID=N6V9U6_9HYPH|nr:hypothetical protein RHSP_47818 [Rhizobium freirei PRF 81]